MGEGTTGRACVPRRRAVHRSWPAGRPTRRRLVVFSSAPALLFSENQELAGKGRLHTTDDGTVLLVRQRTLQPPSDSQHLVGRAAYLLNDEPIHIYAPLLMRPSVMQACHPKASCHLGTTRTHRMLERFYWWIDMRICTRWWLRHCLNGQARHTSRLTVRWPVISMPFPEGPGIAVSVDYVGPLPVTHRGNTYILFLLIVSAAEPACAVTYAESTAQDTANVLINRYIPLWGCPPSILSDNGLHVCSKLRRRSTSFLAFGKLPPAPTTQMAIAWWSV